MDGCPVIPYMIFWYRLGKGFGEALSTNLTGSRSCTEASAQIDFANWMSFRFVQDWELQRIRMSGYWVHVGRTLANELCIIASSCKFHNNYITYFRMTSSWRSSQHLKYRWFYCFPNNRFIKSRVTTCATRSIQGAWLRTARHLMSHGGCDKGKTWRW